MDSFTDTYNMHKHHEELFKCACVVTLRSTITRVLRKSPTVLGSHTASNPHRNLPGLKKSLL